MKSTHHIHMNNYIDIYFIIFLTYLKIYELSFVKINRV